MAEGQLGPKVEREEEVEVTFVHLVSSLRGQPPLLWPEPHRGCNSSIDFYPCRLRLREKAWLWATRPLPWAPYPLHLPSASREEERACGLERAQLSGGLRAACDIHKKDLTDHFLPHYFGIIVISWKHSFFPTQLLMAMVLVWCWPLAMLINGFWIIFIHFAHFTHSTSCDLCSPYSSYFYLNCRASSEF